MPAAPGEAMRTQIDRLLQTAGSAVIVFGWTEDEKVPLLVAVTEDLTKKGVKAGDLIKPIAAVVGGSGGGKPHLAQAGGKDPSKLGEALAKAREVISAALSK
jgi:alanyl-tRNA synthetase